MKIEENVVVGLTYELKVTNEQADSLPFSVEVRDKDDPFYFLVGDSGLPKTFEKNLADKVEGDQFNFTLSVEEAYGKPDDELIVSVPKSQFNQERGFEEEMLQEGNFLPLIDEDGYPMQAKVVKDLGEEVLLDFNHPLTGMNLHFEGEVFAIREATEKEKEEGFRV
ncbi:peptidylprolyl isomerase [Cyclobacterium sp. 1_MG-2023]|uniref:FKBP-type peptidyl-prolyl cis-trans isomerase n=1 Tax=Cyclobacterium sp. 1_MG-2023 TaxID=3062681 RepID=UPI0026E177E4|nr:peptidylprolyl isomerase [Cyclobacterium sp. 1_MG-2023]MDO6439654.1 peptidylprolyl isomerase [Cyclobacterium sp. 1_MG-2023]